MKTIAIEEHFKIPAINEANSGGAQEKAFKLFGSTGIYSTGEDGEVPAGSFDIGLKRLAAMDAGGIDVQGSVSQSTRHGKPGTSTPQSWLRWPMTRSPRQ
jgi:hypothetical protein